MNTVLKVKIYYKVVTLNLKSAFVSSVPELSVQYKINKWVYPNVNNSCLMVFDNLNNARLFRERLNIGLVIYQCEIVKTRKRKPPFCMVGYPYIYFNLQYMLRLKRMHKRCEIWPIDNIPPKNTIFCDSVKLLRKV